jgi:hypothetical protein
VADAPHVRLAEVVGALSLATDIGMGAPLEIGLGTCWSPRVSPRSSAAPRRAPPRVLGRAPAPHRLHGRLARVRRARRTFALFVHGDLAKREARRVAPYMDQMAMAAQLGLIPESQATGATA